MTRPSRAAAFALVAASLAACRPPEPYALPARPITSHGFAAAFESAQQRGASDATLDRMVRSEFATIEPEVSVEPITFDELTPIVGRSTARRLLRGWVVARATLRVRRRSAVDIPFDVTLASGSHLAPVTSVDGQHLSLATGEAYPSGGSRSHLRVDAPLPLVVLTGGILGLATLRVETERLPPAEAQVRAAIPRALRLAKALEATCSHDRCSKAFVFRRPADESAPLALGVSVLLTQSGSTAPDPDGKGGEKAPLAVARLEAGLPEGETLEARLRPTTPVRPAMGSIDRRAPKPEAKPCVELFKSSALACAPPMPLTPWPLVTVGGLGLTLPERPPTLGTPATSVARRPTWATMQGYAPFYEPPAGKMPPPSPGPIDGGLIVCRLKGLDVPGEDTDRVSIRIALDRPRSFYSSYFTVPLVRLAPKRPTRVSFFDSDLLSGDDFLAELTLRREGGRLAAGPRDVHPRRANVDFACEVYDRDAVEAEFANAWYAAADALEAAEEGYRIAFGDTDFGFGENGALRSRARTTNAAALVGWDDPRIIALVERVNKFEAGFYLELRRALERTPQAPGGALTAQWQSTDLRIKGLGARCEADGRSGARREANARSGPRREPEGAACPPCAVDVEVENAGGASAYDVPFNLSLVLDDGRVVPAAPRFPASKPLPPGERARLTLEAKRAPDACSGRPWALLQNDRDPKAFGWISLPPP